MSYEVQFQHEGDQYKVIGPDIDGMLQLIQGLQNNTIVPHIEERRDAAEATLRGLKYEWRGGEQWAPPIGPAPSFVDDPHSELRKTWTLGQRWQTRTRGADEWIFVGANPEWHPDQEYRQCA